MMNPYYIHHWNQETFDNLKDADFPFEKYLLRPVTRNPVINYLPAVADRDYSFDLLGKTLDGNEGYMLRANQAGVECSLSNCQIVNFAGNEYASAIFKGDEPIYTVMNNVHAKGLEGVAATLGRSGSTTINCLFEDCGGNGLQSFDASNIRIERCAARNNNLNGYSLGNHAADLVKIFGGATGTRNVTIKDCRGENLNANMIWLDSDVKFGSIENIQCDTADRSAVMLELCSNIQLININAIRCNQLDSNLNSYTTGAITLMNASDCFVDRCSVYEPGSGGIMLWSWDWDRPQALSGAGLSYPNLLTQRCLVQDSIVDFGDGSHFKQSEGPQLTGTVNYNDTGEPWNHPDIHTDNEHTRCTVIGKAANLQAGNDALLSSLVLGS